MNPRVSGGEEFVRILQSYRDGVNPRVSGGEPFSSLAR